MFGCRKLAIDKTHLDAGIMLNGYHLRIARPTVQLQVVSDFYIHVLGFEKLGEFKDHDGFDGVMVGHSDAPYHLEFTQQKHGDHENVPSKDQLLVFYVPVESRWKEMVDTIERAGATPVPSLNPYWDVRGKSFEDPDGYRIVVQNSEWPARKSD